jgi:hypothetical protein
MGKRKLFIGIDKGYKWQIFDEKYSGLDDIPDLPGGYSHAEELEGIFIILLVNRGKMIEALSQDLEDLKNMEPYFDKYDFFKEEVDFKVGYFEDKYKPVEEFSGAVADGFRFIMKKLEGNE